MRYDRLVGMGLLLVGTVLAAGCLTIGAGAEAPLERAWQAAVVWLPPRMLPAPHLNGRRVAELGP